MAAADLLAQRSPAVRPRLGHSNLSQGPGTPSSPHTPLLSRSLSSQYGSPGIYRADDEYVIYEIGARYLRAGFSGDAAPRIAWDFGPETSARSTVYSGVHSVNFSPVYAGENCPGNLELWDYDVSNLDLGLVEDKLERALRVISEKHLLLDLKTRSAIVALPPGLPNALLETLLKTIFSGINQPRTLFLMSSPTLNTVAAGLRSGLVVDIGWLETTVTVVYEYREVTQKRTIRGVRHLCYQAQQAIMRSAQQTVSFSIVEDVVARLFRCHRTSAAQGSSDLDNLSVDIGHQIQLHEDEMDNIISRAFLTPKVTTQTSDDHEIALPDLIWRALGGLQFDTRAICTSRIMFTGGGSKVPGLKERLLSEVNLLVKSRGWDAVSGRRVEEVMQLEARKAAATAAAAAAAAAAGDESVSRSIRYLRGPGSLEVQEEPGLAEGQVEDERDEISERLEKQALTARPPPICAEVRGVETMGAWAGASLMGHLRVEGSVEIKRDDFMKNGINTLGYPIR